MCGRGTARASLVAALNPRAYPALRLSRETPVFPVPFTGGPGRLECGAIGPVLKHGPRSYTLPRVEGEGSSAKEVC